jgi:hypothetical protein
MPPGTAHRSTSARPSPRISKRPISCVEPNRFFTPRTTRIAECRSPSNAEHDIDKVLEQLRPRERAFLGDVADHHDAAARRLRAAPTRSRRAAPELRDRARRGGDVGAVHELNRVHDDD